MLSLEWEDAPPVLYAREETTLKTTEGKTLLVRNTTQILKTGESASLQVGDKIKTLPRSSATIFWADGSVTRLSEKTSITISSLQVSGDLSSVQIRFDTESGKTWSNVIRSLLPDSFFEQTYDNGAYVATVRGTVFEINLDRDYVRSIHHGISIKNTKTNAKTEVLQGKTIQARNWKILGKELIDTAWDKWNTNEDVIYMDRQLKKLSDNLFDYTQKNEWVRSWTKKIRKLVKKEETPDSLISAIILEKNTDKLDALKQSVEMAKTDEQKSILHARLLAYHQATNILPGNDSTLALRATLRDLIIETAPANKKEKLEQTFTQVTFNDYVDALSTGSIIQADKLKTKLEQAIKANVNLPALEDFTTTATTILNEERVQEALGATQKEWASLLDTAKNTFLETNSQESVDALKKDAIDMFDDLKNIVK